MKVNIEIHLNQEFEIDIEDEGKIYEIVAELFDEGKIKLDKPCVTARLMAVYEGEDISDFSEF